MPMVSPLARWSRRPTATAAPYGPTRRELRRWRGGRRAACSRTRIWAPWPTRSSAGGVADAGRTARAHSPRCCGAWTPRCGRSIRSPTRARSTCRCSSATRSSSCAPSCGWTSTTRSSRRTASRRRSPVRLGALAAWQDGLLGFVVDGDPGTVHATSPAALELAREVGPSRGYLGPVGAVAEFHERVRRRPAARRDAALADHASVRVPRPDRLGVAGACRRPHAARRAAGVRQRDERGPSPQGGGHAPTVDRGRAGAHRAELPVRAGAGRPAEDPHAGGDRARVAAGPGTTAAT